LHDLHVLSDIGEDGRLDEVSDITLALATCLDLGTGFLSSIDVAHNAVKLKLADLRTLECLIIEGVTWKFLGSATELYDIESENMSLSN